MTTSDRDAERFEENLRAALDRGADGLDELTVARLNAARARALEAAGRRRWLPAWLGGGPALGAALGAAMMAVLVVQLLPPETMAPQPVTVAAATAPDVLAEEELDMISELDFLLWLDESDAAL